MFAEDMLLHITLKIQLKVNTFCKIIQYKVNVQELVVFLLTVNKPKRKLREQFDL